MTVIFAFLAMCIVIYLSYVASKYLAKSSMKVNGTKYIKVIDRLMLGKDRYILVARVGKRNFLFGVTDQRVESMVELNEEDLVEIEAPVGPSSLMDVGGFKEKLMTMINKKPKD